jgi:hypothetical protein
LGAAAAFAQIEGADPLEHDEISAATSGLVDERAERREQRSR